MSVDPPPKVRLALASTYHLDRLARHFEFFGGMVSLSDSTYLSREVVREICVNRSCSVVHSRAEFATGVLLTYWKLTFLFRCFGL